MRLRTFQRSDIPVARELLTQLGYAIAVAELTERVERVFAASDHYVAVAEQGGKVVGLIHAFIRPALEKPCEAVVQAIVVDAKWRGHGIGKALMSAAEEWARSKHLKSAALSTRKAEAFYALLGYDKVAAAHFMRKAL